jgi:hypothetical protein
MEDEFMDVLHKFPPLLSYKIGNFIENNITDFPPNDLTTYIVGGLIIYDDEPVTFAVELLKSSGMLLTLTDLSLISMDEYLDLINLNAYIKLNEKNQEPYTHHRVGIRNS